MDGWALLDIHNIPGNPCFPDGGAPWSLPAGCASSPEGRLNHVGWGVSEAPVSCGFTPWAFPSVWSCSGGETKVECESSHGNIASIDMLLVEYDGDETQPFIEGAAASGGKNVFKDFRDYGGECNHIQRWNANERGSPQYAVISKGSTPGRITIIELRNEGGIYIESLDGDFDDAFFDLGSSYGITPDAEGFWDDGGYHGCMKHGFGAEWWNVPVGDPC